MNCFWFPEWTQNGSMWSLVKILPMSTCTTGNLIEVIRPLVKQRRLYFQNKQKTDLLLWYKTFLQEYLPNHKKWSRTRLTLSKFWPPNQNDVFEPIRYLCRLDSEILLNKRKPTQNTDIHAIEHLGWRCHCTQTQLIA